MLWIYLSPHFDDAALSCGGLVWEQVQAGETASIWTICGGVPLEPELSPFAQSLHSRWGLAGDAEVYQAVERRRAEDIESCARLGASYRHFQIPDCIYRAAEDPLYATEESLFGSLHPAEESLVQLLSLELALAVPEDEAVRLVCPLAIGGHVDHRLARAAAERTDLQVWYYGDYPYVLTHPHELARLQREGWQARSFSISGEGLRAWQESVAAHISQISTFWDSLEEMRSAILAYSQAEGGVRLWRPENGV